MADPTPASKTFIEYLSQLSPIFLLVVGGLVTHLWSRYRSRTGRLTWRAWHSPVAVAADYPQLGRVTVQFNGMPVNHLHHTRVEFTNDSSRDLKEVEVMLSFGSTGHVISSTGVVEGTLAIVPFDTDYLGLYANATQQQINTLNTYVVHRIPVLNRRQKSTFTMLVARDDTSSPQVTVSSNHLGMRTEFLPATPELFGVPVTLALLVGLPASLACALLVVRFQHHSHRYLTVAFAWLLGTVCMSIGAELVRLGKQFLRILG